MKAMGAETRAHEETRMTLNNTHLETMKGLDMQAKIARDQADVLGAALARAKIDIVGGDGEYFEKFVKALSLGKGIDGLVAKSQTMQVALKDHLSGEKSFVDDAKGLLAALGSSSSDAANLSVAALVSRITTSGTPAQKDALEALLGKATHAATKPGKA